MADNVVVTAGSGTTIAADEVVDGTLGTVKVQYVKIMDATLDGTTKAAVGANGLKVDGSGATQPVSGTVTANQGTAAAATAGWPTISGQPADTTGTFTNATQTTSVTTGTINGYETVTVSINGTFGTATAVFEASDDAGTTWYGVQGARSDSSTIESGYTTLTNTSRMWIIPVTGADQFRVRSTAVASGTVNVRVSPTSAASSDSAVVSLGSALPAGSNVIGHVIADSGSTTAVTGNVTVVQATGTNLHAVIDSGSTTAVTQATGTNLHTVVDSGSITANIGTSGSLALAANQTNGTQVVQLYDGVRNGTIKASGGAALTTDTALVVAISPNNTVGANIAQINAVTPLMGNGVTGTGSQRVTIASDNTAFSVNAVQSGTWNIGTVTTVTAVTAISNALPAGTNILGHVIDDASATAGGISTTARLASAAASTNATNVKGSAGRIYQIGGKNNAAYDVFLVLYDSAANPPVPGSTTIRKKVVCPAGQAFVYDFSLGLSFATGIGYAFTKLVADADTTVLVAADITAFNLDYV